MPDKEVTLSNCGNCRREIDPRKNSQCCFCKTPLCWDCWERVKYCTKQECVQEGENSP